MAMTLLLLCILNSRIKVTAADMSGTLHSKGAMQCEQAVLDAADLRSIHSYLLEKKNTAASILLQLGTRFRQQSGEVVYDRNPDAEQEEVDLSQISWPVLIRAVEDSQTIPEGLSVPNRIRRYSGANLENQCHLLNACIVLLTVTQV